MPKSQQVPPGRGATLFPRATAAFFRMADPEGLGQLTTPTKPPGGGYRSAGGGQGVLCDDYGNCFQPEAVAEAQALKHQQSMERLAAQYGLQRAEAERKAQTLPEATHKLAAAAGSTGEMAKETKAELKDLAARGKTVSSPWVEAFAGMAERWVGAQPAQMIRSAGYDLDEQSARANLAILHAQLVETITTGAPSDADVRRLEEINPLAPGKSMERRIAELGIMEEIAKRSQRNLAAGRRAPGAPAVPTPPSGANFSVPTAPATAPIPSSPPGAPAAAPATGGFRYLGAD